MNYFSSLLLLVVCVYSQKDIQIIIENIPKGFGFDISPDIFHQWQTCVKKQHFSNQFDLNLLSVCNYVKNMDKPDVYDLKNAGLINALTKISLSVQQSLVECRWSTFGARIDDENVFNTIVNMLSKRVSWEKSPSWPKKNNALIFWETTTQMCNFYSDTHPKYDVIGLKIGEILNSLKPLTPNFSKSALIVIDIQNDFCNPNTGSLYVSECEVAVNLVNHLITDYEWGVVAYSQDWHPKGHWSFYDTWKNDPKAEMYKPFVLPNGQEQVLWPIHCVQNTFGAEFYTNLVIKDNSIHIKKGTQLKIDSYSAFMDNDHNLKTQTPLDKLLLKHDIQSVFVVGVAYDFCVGFTSLDAHDPLKYTSYVIEDATRAVDPASKENMKKNQIEKGVMIIQSDSLTRIVE